MTICEATETDYLVCTEVKPLSVSSELLLKSLRLRRKEIETSGEELSLILKRKTLWLETKQAQGAS